MAKTKKSTTPTKSSNGSKKQKLETPVLTIAERRIVLIQYEKENDSEDALPILAEYLKFMQIKIGEQGTNDCCAPSKSIDEMWHAHILATKEYFAFCDRHNDGKYIHHDPSMTSVPARYEMTMQRYRELFGVVKDRGIWPLPMLEDTESDGYDYEDDMGCG